MVVVLFQTKLKPGAALPDYEATAHRMFDLVSQMPGFHSFRSFTSPEGEELSVVQFESEDTLAAWRNHPDHLKVQQEGRDTFFERYHVQVCSVLREYEFPTAVA